MFSGSEEYSNQAFVKSK